MHLMDTALPEVKVVMPERIGDARGFFSEVWNARDFASVGMTLLSCRIITSGIR
jgi:dTDP-4-dehydrorhamnose 3,5-epimerase